MMLSVITFYFNFFLSFTAVIRNICFEKVSFCKEVENFKGIEAMVKVSS